MAEPEEIFRAALELLHGPSSLRGKRVLVTAGGTREPLDAVRYVGNRSSGRMGVALAEEARRRGAEVDAARSEPRRARTGGSRARSRRRPPSRSRARGARPRRRQPTSSSWRPRSPTTGPPSRWRPSGRRTQPRGRSSSNRPQTFSRALGAKRRDGQLLVGFAAETGEDGLERARAKLERKSADLFVFNDVSRPDIGFDAPDNAVTLVDRLGERPLAKAPKGEIAAAILDEVERLSG